MCGCRPRKSQELCRVGRVTVELEIDLLGVDPGASAKVPVAARVEMGRLHHANGVCVVEKGTLLKATVVSRRAMPIYIVQPIGPEGTPLEQKEVVAKNAEEAARLVTGVKYPTTIFCGTEV